MTLKFLSFRNVVRFTGNQGQAIQSNFYGSRQTIQFRQSALSAPYYVHIWYHPLGVASGLIQHPFLSSKMDKFFGMFLINATTD